MQSMGDWKGGIEHDRRGDKHNYYNLHHRRG